MASEHDNIRRPGDEDDPGAPQTGEDTCPTCGGSGVMGDGECPQCLGSGKITAIVGDA